MLKFLDKLATSGVRFASLKSSQKELARVLENEKIATVHNGVLYLNNAFIYGRLSTNSNGAGFLPRQNCGAKNPRNHSAKDQHKDDIKILPKDLCTARRGDIVIARKIGYVRSRECARVVVICARAMNSTVVELVRIKGVYMGKCFRTGLCMQLNASQKSLAALPRAAVLAVEIADKNEITEVLGVMDDPAVDELISLRIFAKREEFDEASLLQARANLGKLDASMYPEREDLRDLAFCTIDPVHAKDFDDAIYFDAAKRQLWVMIADVSEYVSAFSALDSEALRRGFSVYLPHKSVPMLPRELSEGVCSLNPGEDKLAFGFCLSFSENFELENARLIEAIIRSHRRFNYDEVDEFLRTKAPLGEANFIYELFTLTQILRKKRLRAGYDFDTAELRLELDGTALKRTYFEHSSPSHKLIEDCMLEANKAAARLLGDKGIFRNHASPNLSKIAQMFNDLEALGLKFKQGKNLHESIENIQEIADEMGIKEQVDKIIIRSFKKAEYGSSCLGHYALGFDRYSHFTSPIRRYSDLILHRLLKAILRNDERLFGYYASELEERCGKISALERDAEKVAKDFAARKFARWANGKIGCEFDAMMLADESLPSAQLLDCEAAGARVFLQRGALAFSKVRVQISDVDLHAAVIYARVI